MLRNLARRLARREGSSNEHPIYMRLRSKITAAVWKRVARMVMACMPKQGAWDDGADDGQQEIRQEVDRMASLRAGDPSTSVLPSFDCGTTAGPSNGPQSTPNQAGGVSGAQISSDASVT
eukprot:10814196-Karenia_brevis.AAC.1